MVGEALELPSPCLWIIVTAEWSFDWFQTTGPAPQRSSHTDKWVSARSIVDPRANPGAFWDYWTAGMSVREATQMGLKCEAMQAVSQTNLRWH